MVANTRRQYRVHVIQTRDGIKIRPRPQTYRSGNAAREAAAKAEAAGDEARIESRENYADIGWWPWYSADE